MYYISNKISFQDEANATVKVKACWANKYVRTNIAYIKITDPYVYCTLWLRKNDNVILYILAFSRWQQSNATNSG